MNDRIRISLGLACLLALGGGCNHRPWGLPSLGQYEPFAKAMNDLQWYVGAYGFGSLSAPLLVQPDETFTFNLTRETPDTFFEAARREINGRSAGASQNVTSAGVGLSVSVDVLAMQQYLAALSSYRKDAGVIAEKQRLLDQAAMVQYQAAMQAAGSITDPSKRADAEAAAMRTLQAAFSGPLATDTAKYPDPPTTSPSAPTPGLAPSAGGLLGALAAPQSLYATGTPGAVTQTRAALLLAAGDTATNAILSLLGAPEKMSRFAGKKVLFGVSMVSVTPGWITQRKFAADISSRFNYESVPARPAVRSAFLALKETSPVEAAALRELQACVTTTLSTAPAIEFGELCPAGKTPPPFQQARFAPYLFRDCDDRQEEQPVVAAVSPMGDAQMLDLQSALRRQREVAMQIDLALSYAGAKGAAAAFAKWARQRQHDVQTRSANVVVNAYSLSGGIFGFHIGPRLVADPEQQSGSASLYQLDRQAFPTLIILGYDEDALRPRVHVRAGPEGPRCYVVERQMRFSTHTHWLPITRDAPLLTEDETLRVTREAHDAAGACKDLPPALKTRMSWLRVQLIGEETPIQLPVALMTPGPPAPPAKPSAESIAPAGIVLERDGTGAPLAKAVRVMLAGADLDHVDTKQVSFAMGKARWLSAVSGGQVVPTPNVTLLGGTLVLTLQVESDDEPVVFNLPIKGTKASIKSPPLVVHLEKARPPEPPPPPIVGAINRPAAPAAALPAAARPASVVRPTPVARPARPEPLPRSP